LAEGGEKDQPIDGQNQNGGHAETPIKKIMQPFGDQTTRDTSFSLRTAAASGQKKYTSAAVNSAPSAARLSNHLSLRHKIPRTISWHPPCLIIFKTTMGSKVAKATDTNRILIVDGD
jgi:hypothetical protein